MVKGWKVGKANLAETGTELEHLSQGWHSGQAGFKAGTLRSLTHHYVRRPRVPYIGNMNMNMEPPIAVAASRYGPSLMGV